MKKNLNLLDRLVRTLIAIVVFYLIYDGTLAGTWAYVLGALSVVFVGTAFVSWCPIYHMLGWSTAPRTKADE